MATVPAHKRRAPLVHPEHDISHSAKLAWMIVVLLVLAFIFVYLAWAASRVS